MALSSDLPLPPELAADPPLDLDLLDQVLAEEAEDDPGEWARTDDEHQAVGHWLPEDDGAAEWCARHLVAAFQELKALEDQAEDWSLRISQWFEQAAKVPSRRALRFQEYLKQYGLARREATGKATLSLPSATVKTTAHSPRAVVADPEGLISWARENLEAAEVAQVIRQPDPEVAVMGLRQVVSVVEVVDEWRAVITCGCVVHLAGLPSLEPGTGTVCPSCGKEGLIGQLYVEQSHWEVQDKAGRVVAGADVDPGSVTVKVVPHA